MTALHIDDLPIDERTAEFKATWGGVEDVLHRACRDHSDNNSRLDVMTKVILIERAYAAGAQRLFPPERGGRAVDRIADCLMGDAASALKEARVVLDKIREPLVKRGGLGRMNDDMRAVIVQHGQLTEAMRARSQKNKSPRSFVSKYLHFHHPVVPIYDDYCARNLTKLVRWDRETKRYAGVDSGTKPDGADDKYFRFCVRFFRLYDALHTAGRQVTVRDLDHLLWQVPV